MVNSIENHGNNNEACVDAWSNAITMVTAVKVQCSAYDDEMSCVRHY